MTEGIMKTRTIAAVVVWFLSVSMLSVAQSPHPLWVPDGTPICTATYNQRNPEMIPDGAGGAFVVWTDVRTYDFDIYAQRVTERGAPLWGINGVPLCTWPDVQSTPRLVSDGAGGAIVAWYYIRNTDFNIYAQRFDINGNIMWADSGVAVADTINRQENHMMTTDGAGGAIVVWEDRRNADKDLYVQRLDPNGNTLWQRNGIRITPDAAWEQSPQIISDGVGGAIIVWEDTRAGLIDIYAQRIDANGDKLWTPSGVAICTAGDSQHNPNLTTDGAGGAIIAWYDPRTQVDHVLWQADGDTVCTNSYRQFTPWIVSDDAGGAIVAWYEDNGPSYDIRAQRIDPDGAVLWTEDAVDVCTATGSQSRINVISDGSGGAVIAWEDMRGGSWTDIYAQRLAPNGTVLWETDGVAICKAFSDQELVRLATDGAGGALFVWEDTRNNELDIYGSLIDANGQLVPTLLQSFDARCVDGAVFVTWTVSEAADAGQFGVYRKDVSSTRAWAEVSVEIEGRGTSYSFTDPTCVAGSGYRYRVDVADESGRQTLFETDAMTIPAATAELYQNVPNPFNPSTSVRYYLPREAAVTLRIYDTAGRLVATLVDDEVRAAGPHVVEWNGRDTDGRMAASGVYFYRLDSGKYTASRKMVLLR
jgi:hypothetical protein